MSRHSKRRSPELLAYGSPSGDPGLREVIAEYLETSRALNCAPSQVMIVPGSQMALQICARTLSKPGDIVCMEEPGYPGARQALAGAGATVVPINVDEQGISVDELRHKGRGAKVVYVTPSHQYPLGTTMSASRRLQLLEWAHRNHGWIIEDDYDSEYRFASRPIGALQGMDVRARVIYIGSFSKVLFPSLRLGYMVIPSKLFDSVAAVRESFDICSPNFYQIVLTDFIREGHFNRHLRKMRGVYAARRNALVDSLSTRLDKYVKIGNSEAGLHLAVFLLRTLDDTTVVKNAAKRGVVATSLSACYAGRTSKPGLILGFGGANVAEIDLAVTTLCKAIRG